MCQFWAVENLTGLGVTLEAIALAEINLADLASRASELDDWHSFLPTDDLQQINETTARVSAVQEELHGLHVSLGATIFYSTLCRDEPYSHDGMFDGYRLGKDSSQFNRHDLLVFLSKLSALLAKGVRIGVTISQQAQALTKAIYPAYECPKESQTHLVEYGEGHGVVYQDLDNSKQSHGFPIALQKVVVYSGEDTSNLRILISQIEEKHRELSAQIPTASGTTGE